MPRPPSVKKTAKKEGALKKTKPAYQVLIARAHADLIRRNRGGYGASAIYFYLLKQYASVSRAAISRTLTKMAADGLAAHEGARWKVTKLGRSRLLKKKKSKRSGASGFIKFSVEKRPEVIAENPGLTFGEIGQALGAAWKKLSDAEKAKYGASKARKSKKDDAEKPKKKKSAPAKGKGKGKKAEEPKKKAAKGKGKKAAAGEKKEEPKKKKAAKRAASPKRKGKKAAEAEAAEPEIGGEIEPEAVEAAAPAPARAGAKAKGRAKAKPKAGRGADRADEEAPANPRAAAPKKVGRKATVPLGDDSSNAPLDPRAQKATPSYDNLEGVQYKWQYDDHGWRDYSQKASDVVEGHWKAFQADQHSFDVRAVQSGDWEYQVDFKSMTQTNVVHPAHTVRKIRRVIKN